MPGRIESHGRGHRPLLAAAGAFVLTLGGCSAAVTPTVSAVGIAWTDCPPKVTDGLASAASALVGKVEMACGTLQVPLDHERPAGAQLTMQVIRARATEQSNRIGSVIFNPGGPGASGLDYLPSLLAVLPAEIFQRFDVVSFDPRGTGGSAPINCPRWPEQPPGAPEPDLLDETGFATASRLEQQFAQGCLQVLGERAPHFTTAATARDLDLLRIALGDDRLNYLGQSYGAKLGAEYARRFPAAVRVAVLDAPSEPRGTLVQDLVRQARGFEHTFDVYAAGCPERPACHLGRDPRAFVTRLVAKANKAAIASSARADANPATGADVLDTVRGALYVSASWSDLD